MIKSIRNDLIAEIKTKFEQCFSAETVTIEELTDYSFKLIINNERSWRVDMNRKVSELIGWLIKLTTFQHQHWDEDFQNGIVVKNIITILVETR